MKSSFLSITMFLISSIVFSQKVTEVIKVSAQCGMCKERIEKLLMLEKGVKTADVDLEKKTATVTFNSKKTNLDKLRKAISKAGHDADDVVADPKAYEKLPACCKKPDDSNHKSH